MSIAWRRKRCAQHKYPKPRKRLNDSGISVQNPEREEPVMVTFWMDQSEKNILIAYEYE